MKLKIVTPIESAPMASVPSPPQARPAMNVDAIPIKGTVTFEMMFGIAILSMSLFIMATKVREFCNFLGIVIVKELNIKKNSYLCAIFL